MTNLLLCVDNVRKCCWRFFDAELGSLVATSRFLGYRHFHGSALDQCKIIGREEILSPCGFLLAPDRLVHGTEVFQSSSFHLSQKYAQCSSSGRGFSVSSSTGLANSRTPCSSEIKQPVTSNDLGDRGKQGNQCSQPSSPSTSSESPCTARASESDKDSQASEEPLRITLREAVLRLADASVAKVEEGDMDGAVAILKEGISGLGPKFPDSPEVGELHNQAGLLLYMQGKVDEAEHHAKIALDLTARAFGVENVLTGHRMLRLGAVKVGQGQLAEATQLLTLAGKALQQDPSKYEADLYLHLISLSGAAAAGQVLNMESDLIKCAGEMKEAFGAESMVLGMVMAQHDRIVTQALAAQTIDTRLCEALMKQHSRLLELLDPSSEDLAIMQYKLATFYYTQDLLQDANQALRVSTSLLKERYPEDHPLVIMCLHRMGMICAASGDHRSAVKLLTKSREKYREGGSLDSEAASTHALAKEADFGLALARFRSIDPAALPREQCTQLQHQRLAEARPLLDDLAASIGPGHMLVQGAMRYFAQITVMMSKQRT
ncbi:hypothetical protein CEUSTIGMA_g2742.t1 [Chlamydomonas eustigma]|uniref:MalT-like TPR region domain-containing protein n=1 Tax=Chlamydomonas eustigma TaxID=1157962 RepID=A0A250WWS9_9CHLO|nr:hypothetical protein CEUSTIGMA_g2742.t1 [Chlamydomonas eustigma]|eukprot:GAX75297.1 hypothetical protein CEUSTIGMA_g2742.t1 [Chlamydomonas eustigma]